MATPWETVHTLRILEITLQHSDHLEDLVCNTNIDLDEQGCERGKWTDKSVEGNEREESVVNQHN